MFRFQQFVVHDELCAMKVGTDGTLLGAWCPLPETVQHILDVGTGSGLIAMMIAQRISADSKEHFAIDAIDIVPEAVAQAKANFEATPWSSHLTAYQQDIRQMVQNQQYDLVVSNPPYFQDSLKNPDAGRMTARHTDSLAYQELIEAAARLLRPNGCLAVILPAEAEAVFLRLGQEAGLTPLQITRVRTKAGKPCKRVMLCLLQGISSTPCIENELCLMASDGQPRSRAYQDLCKAFYL